ncbi:uncharacterized protein KQ657_001182 [Scheffersomyces spartinae]|uniref:Phospholipid/glycerol acyltransferase domain-containing protein n=1 Tax=Scheffersomyces spartinae TaxID=45513 RepID=A0A9P8AIF4_9ASCO|nr:uncharacterized protein KQ657_001182 [Scheffersomyces spartinae]KAG7193065.1 hypothetical protein KQ657_001182 [Scheffersomyces spartinae]
MEKFSAWRDSGTGISPFMPAPKPTPSFLKKVSSPFSLLWKVPVLVLAFVFGLYKFILISLYGFNNIDLTIDGVKKSKLEVIKSLRPDKGQVIFTNYVSPVDYMICKCISKSPSSTLCLIPDTKGDLYQFTVSQFFSKTLSGQFDFGNGIKFTDFKSLKSKTTFVFFEGTPSNNKAILPFIANLEGSLLVNNATKLRVLALKVVPLLLTTPLPLSSYSYYYELLTNSNRSNAIKCKLYDINDISKNINNDIVKAFEYSGLYQVGPNMIVENKKKFYDYYTNYQNRKN